MMPERVQLKRTKGWRMPEGAVKVDRTTIYGNPYRAGGEYIERYTASYRAVYSKVRDQAHAVELFRRDISRRYWGSLDFGPTDVARLRGKDLACWCRPGEPCHADVLLEFANRPLTVIQGGEA